MNPPPPLLLPSPPPPHHSLKPSPVWPENNPTIQINVDNLHQLELNGILQKKLTFTMVSKTQTYTALINIPINSQLPSRISQFHNRYYFSHLFYALLVSI